VLAVPGGSAPFLVLVLVREDHAPFVSAEVDRRGGPSHPEGARAADRDADGVR
jgi:hypothetical protein